MKVSQAIKEGRFNYMQQRWNKDGTVDVTVIDYRNMLKGKAKFKRDAKGVLKAVVDSEMVRFGAKTNK